MFKCVVVVDMCAAPADMMIGTTTARATSPISVVRALARSTQKVRGLTTACRDASASRLMTEERFKVSFTAGNKDTPA